MLTRREWITAIGAAPLLPAAPAVSDWPQFRGPDRNANCRETGLARKWPASGPRVLWTVPVAQGYAGAAIVAGRVYHHDYDEAKSEWCVNCRSLADGKLVWQFREAREIRPNHAITRTVPAVDTTQRRRPSARQSFPFGYCHFRGTASSTSSRSSPSNWSRQS